MKIFKLYSGRINKRLEKSVESARFKADFRQCPDYESFLESR